jgi:hypothetical protein
VKAGFGGAFNRGWERVEKVAMGDNQWWLMALKPLMAGGWLRRMGLRQVFKAID